MCGRYSQSHSLKALEKAFKAIANAEFSSGPSTQQSPQLSPSYNITPGQQIAAVRTDENGRKLVALRWGLIPSWMKELPKSLSMINARAETVADKPSFRAAYKRRRCLIPADGFYEWRKEGDNKQPYYIHMPDKQLFAFAGLWEHWSKDEENIESCAIITTSANKVMQPIHERMPVIVAEQDYELWLGEQEGDISPLLMSHQNDSLLTYPVSRHVNSPRNNDVKCVERLDG